MSLTVKDKISLKDKSLNLKNKRSSIYQNISKTLNFTLNNSQKTTIYKIRKQVKFMEIGQVSCFLKEKILKCYLFSKYKSKNPRNFIIMEFPYLLIVD